MFVIFSVHIKIMPLSQSATDEYVAWCCAFVLILIITVFIASVSVMLLTYSVLVSALLLRNIPIMLSVRLLTGTVFHVTILVPVLTSALLYVSLPLLVPAHAMFLK